MEYARSSGKNPGLEFSRAVKSDLCIILDDTINDATFWQTSAKQLLLLANQLNLNTTVIGQRAVNHMGLKRCIRFFDRHKMIDFKYLRRAKSKPLELRVFNRKSLDWSRIRSDLMVVFSRQGFWPRKFIGWDRPGTLSIDALRRWVEVNQELPGKNYIFLGATNESFRFASKLLTLGAQRVLIVDEKNTISGWRSYRDQFLSLGGRLLLEHKIVEVKPKGAISSEVILINKLGRLIEQVDVVVLAPSVHVTNFIPTDGPFEGAPKRVGHIFVGFPLDGRLTPEDDALLRLDVDEVTFRLLRTIKRRAFDDVDRAVKKARFDRESLMQYRNAQSPGLGHTAQPSLEFAKNSKLLDSSSLIEVKSSVSTPNKKYLVQPVASLECFENVGCSVCADVCPAKAITFKTKVASPQLNEELCTGCSLCVAHCPPGAAVMIQEAEPQQRASYFLPAPAKEFYQKAQEFDLGNRRGDWLASSKLVQQWHFDGALHSVVRVDTSSIYLWDIRTVKKKSKINDALLDDAIYQSASNKVWLELNDKRRLCRSDKPLSISLWQMGERRFEDALLCANGSCKRCVVEVNGDRRLSCEVTPTAGQNIRVKQQTPFTNEIYLCPCKGLTVQNVIDVASTYGDGEGPPNISVAELQSVTGLGLGECLGTWCLRSQELFDDILKWPKEKRQRPYFWGFYNSPWQSLTQQDFSKKTLK